MRKPLYQRAYDEIRSAILSGHFIPRQRLYETDLAALLSISRSPVKEELLQLAQEDRSFNSAYKDFEYLYYCRILLEIEGAGCAAQHATPTLLVQIQETLVLSQKTYHKDPELLPHLTRFHELMLQVQKILIRNVYLTKCEVNYRELIR